MRKNSSSLFQKHFEPEDGAQFFIHFLSASDTNCQIAFFHQITFGEIREKTRTYPVIMENHFNVELVANKVICLFM